MTIETYSYTNAGGRPNNEDACLTDDGIWILADGLGGHENGEVASGETVRFVYVGWKQLGEPLDDEPLLRLLDGANAHLIEVQQADERCADMRTTLVFAVTDGRILRYVNVGDSRFYLFREGRLLLQTEDHSVPGAVARMGQMRYEDVRFSEDRNKLLKVIGNSEGLNMQSIPKEVELQPGDAFLLCSDGFWEYIYEQEMEIDLSKSSNPQQWLQYMVKRLLLRTGNKDNDNFTAICVMTGDDSCI